VNSAPYQVHALLEFADARCATILTSLEELFLQGLVVSSVYSGLGTFELAVDVYMQQLSVALKMSSSEVPGLYWSACDRAPWAQKVLQAHPPGTPSLHLWGGLLDRLQYPDKEALLQVQEEMLAIYEIMKKQADEGLRSNTSLSEVKLKRGQELVNRQCAILEGV